MGRDDHQHPLFARLQERRAARDEARGQAELRRELLVDLTGRVLEVGVGTGLSFAHYPDTVREVLAVEPEDHMRLRATEAAMSAPVPVTVTAGVADDVPAADDSFDAVVVSGVLCSVPDPLRTLGEFRRVLRPGGQLRFYEHVRDAAPWGVLRQELANPWWRRTHGGCELTRPTWENITTAGFIMTSYRHLRFPRGARFGLAAPRLLGRAMLDDPRNP